MSRFGLGNLFGRNNVVSDRRKKPRKKHPSQRSILIVDDSSTVLYAVKKMLEQDGYEVLVAGDGEEAILITEAFSPDLILMDVIMPGMNGYQATRRIRRLPGTENIPIIIISGSEQKTEEFWLRKLGANDYLAKPIRRAELFSLLEKYLFTSKVA